MQNWLLEQPWNNYLLMIIMIWIQVGFAMVVLSAAIKAIPMDVTEAAMLDGATGWKLFRRVTVPMIRGTLVVVLTTIAIGVLPEAMTLWRREYPETRCELGTHHTSEIVNTLRLGEADLALSLQDPRHPGIVAEAIAQGVMTVIAPAGTWTEEECRQPISAEGLVGELIGMTDNDPLGELLVASFPVFARRRRQPSSTAHPRRR